MAQWQRFAIPDPAALGLNHGSGKIVSVADLIDCALRVETAKGSKVDQTDPVLASGKLVVAKYAKSIHQSFGVLKGNIIIIELLHRLV